MPSKTSRRNASKARQAARAIQVEQDQSKDVAVAEMNLKMSRMALRSAESAETLVEEEMLSPGTEILPLTNGNYHGRDRTNDVSLKHSRKTVRSARVTSRVQVPLLKNSDTGMLSSDSGQSMETLVEEGDTECLTATLRDAPGERAPITDIAPSTSEPEIGPQRLPAEVLGICARYLKDDNCYRSLASLNVVSRSVRYATEPTVKHTICIYIDPTRRYITFSKFLDAIALEYPDSHHHIRFAFSPPRQIMLSPRDTKMIMTGKGCADTAPHTTVLFRLKTDDPFDCQTVMRLSKDYQPFSDESHDFIRKHGSIDYTPEDPRLPRTRSHTVIVLAPSSANDMAQVRRTRTQSDKLKQYNFCPDVQEKTVKLLKASEERFDPDYLHLLVIDLAELCGRYQAPPAKRAQPRLFLEGLDEEETAIAAEAFMKALSLEDGRKDRRCLKIQFRINGMRPPGVRSGLQ